VLALGVALVAVSALADPIGIGSDDRFGWKQVAGIVIGGGAAVLGLARLFFSRSDASKPTEIGAEKTG
jgi:hypothetical protein